MTTIFTVCLLFAMAAAPQNPSPAVTGATAVAPPPTITVPQGVIVLEPGQPISLVPGQIIVLN